jgi:toxin secretion/phage lysis holin
MSRKGQETNNNENMHINEIILTIKSTFSSIYLKSILAGICSFVMYSIGYDYQILQIVAYIVIIDWILGVAIALKHSKFTSWKLIKTGYKIVFYLLLIVVAHQAQSNMFFPEWFDDFVEFLVIITEIKSIFENAAMLGFKQAIKVEEKINQLLSDKFKRK